ncbi:MAG: ATPase, T2SS/T4P/T4SS family [Planctomycetota bacterium]
MTDEFQDRKLLGEILLEMGLIEEETLTLALEQQSAEGGMLGEILIDMSEITTEDLTVALAEQAGLEVIDLSSVEVGADAIAAVDANMAMMMTIMPVHIENGVLTVAMCDPNSITTIDELKFMLNMEIHPVVALAEDINHAIQEHYGGVAGSIGDVLSEFKDEDLDELDVITDDADHVDLDAETRNASAAPVVKFLNLILLTAIRDQASDIHFEPFENNFKIRYRIDGTLLEITPPPLKLALALISRIKVMSNLDIAERRVPQDGRIELTIGGNPIDLRVSTLPTMFGESVVMRILDRSVVDLNLDRLGMRDDELAFFRNTVNKPNGIVLVTGPTGSGKTTTLYSALNEANTIDVKIIRTEDPVEYDLDGIIQVPIIEDIGKTYAACLRSILRQDPDTILVGEIRDLETAGIAIEASLTGHLVFSTLHTNDAPSTVTRMVDMGVEPFLVSATLDSVVAQRLVRKICKHCMKQYDPTEEMLLELQLLPEDVEGKKFFYGTGCEKCNNTGYRGRNAIFEIMIINSQLRELIIEKKSTGALREAAQASGMRALRESGILKIFDGITTIEEVVRETLAFE